MDTVNPDNHSPPLEGYRLTQLLHAGSRSLVYRGIRLTDELAVVLKFSQDARPWLQDLLQLRNHYIITKNLNLPGVVQPLGLEPYGHGFVLVMADEGYIALSDYIKAHPLNLAEFLAIAIQLADILHHLYQHRVIHKDIKPANILIHPESKHIQLIDFSSASLLPKETEDVKPPSILEGTLAYLAPEQTGRMNRGIDYRTDFYALGVTFFELLTGQLPFRSNDPLELLHGHIAKPAPSVCEFQPDIPPGMGQIVAKLLAKNAEDRYQSALGLRYDLNQIRHRWEQSEDIEAFELGSRDMSDRFLIPEKLYGREFEINTLLHTFSQVSQGITALILVKGFSGIGKTAIVHEVHKPIVQQRGYFIQGKFDQFNRNIPFSAFVQAFRNLMGQLLSESEAQLQVWKSQILAAVGENGQVIIDVVPELEQIIGAQPEAMELSGTAAQHRFNLLFQKFIQVFATAAHPLVMFLDDLQWADSTSLHFLQRLIAELETGYLLLIGAYRDHEVSPVHPLMLTLETLSQTQAKITTIALPPLSLSSLNHWVADTLNCSQALAQPLTELVFQKTQGNPFFATQFLQSLHQDGLIEFDLQAGHWQCDIVRVREAALTDDVVEFMTLQLQKLPPATQAALKLAACIGNPFDLATLAIVRDPRDGNTSEQSEIETATVLWAALQQGVILPLSEIYKFFQEGADIGREPTSEFWMLDSATCTYRFLHDRVQEAAYSMIPASQKEAVHLQIGRLLLERIPPNDRELQLFQIVNQLNHGITLIRTGREREELAHLNWRAGAKARAASAYEAAMNYLDIGIQLLSPQSWKHQYSLSLRLHHLATEVAYLCGAYDRMAALITAGLQHSNNHLDRAKFYEIQILALVAQNQTRAAVDYARHVLPNFGVQLPQNLSKPRILLGFFATLYRMAGKTPRDLLTLPVMLDPDKLAACTLINAIGAATERGLPEILPFITFTGISLYLRYGNIPKSSLAYTIYAFLLCEKLGRVDAGYAIGKAAIALCHRTSSKAALASTLFLWNRFIAYRKESLSSTLQFLLEAYQVSLEVGDVEYAAYSLCFYFSQAFWAGQNLVDLRKEAIASRPTFQKLQQQAMAALQDLNCQGLDNLTTDTGDACQLVGRFFDETAITAADGHLQAYTSIRKLQLACLFRRYAMAMEQIAIVETRLGAIEGTFNKSLFYFYAALVRLGQYPNLPPKQQRACLNKVKAALKHLSRLAKSAPMNYQHKACLVEAERLRVLGQMSPAEDRYDRAISGAKAQGYLQEEALANELAAQFYLDRGKEKIAQVYLIEAYYCYARWGAVAKVTDLEIRYPQLLLSVLQPERAVSPARTTSSTYISHGPQALDLETLLKVCQAISGEIELDQLLATLLTIVITNAGADKCVLLLQTEQGLQIVAQVETGQQPHILPSPTPLDLSPNVAIGLVSWVQRHLEPLVLSHGRQNPQFVRDRYLIEHQPKSVMCSPIMNQGQLLGVLYLENNLMVDAFTHDRIELLNLLCTQAAISLENAQLYHQLEQANLQLAEYSQTLTDKVAERTQELSQAIIHLQSTQQELIQSEKMAALGQLTASVAHEINTPLGVICGATANIMAAFETTLRKLPPLLQQLSPQQQADFLALVNRALQQQHPPSTQAERQLRQQLQSQLADRGLAEAPRIASQLTLLRLGTDFDPYQSLLFDPNAVAILETAYNLVLQHQNAQSIQQEVDRAAKIVFALKTYSHPAKSGEKSLVAVTESIEVALTLYHNRLKQGIEVIRRYAPGVANILCNPDELTQVWVNLIDNAIYAMGEQGILEITVTQQTDRVVVEITDSGCGIPAELQSRIFDPLFTTKPRGEGSGLGLDIVRQLLHKHAGEIQVQSQPNRTTFTVGLPLLMTEGQPG
ncbi:hypothetical protein BST81_01450 [Leptolyngbya sp. 'hensonii']|uniref:trifunctional serine/threonine-protein kinase/ATP-binding protein/sensor histidine kinase n=1 Tax=Leptolyngbya sp. 'hensonii' TaxID=1922337 RepID=UPI00094F68F2|nr:AAA family ATPase [Leptolyngbya sp. 'hensonii']OLP20127.1 hypothetical protein BST81_01450 [Leptolyngbya sp. 'hensonii']